MRFCYEFVGRGLQEKHGFDITTYWGTDILLDENFKPYWVESNLGASNGDKAEENPDCGFAANPAFQEWGKECFDLWIAAARDFKGYINKDRIEKFVKLQGSEGQTNPYEKEQETLVKLFDLWLWVTIGTTNIPPCVPGEHYNRFPSKMNLEQAYKLHDLIPRITKDQIKSSFDRLYEASDTKDTDYFHLCQLICELYSRLEILEIYEKIFQ